MTKKKEHVQKHIHLWDIPSRYIPRKSNGKAYARELLRITKSLDFTDRQIQYSAQICGFNIKSINQKSGFIPYPPDVFAKLEEFVYHYENYCYRLYTYREKLLQFVNAVLPVGYQDREVRIRFVLINPIVKQAGILQLLALFKKNASLSKVIEERTQLTHRLYYWKDVDTYLRPMTEIKKDKELLKWYDDWKKEVSSRAILTNKCSKLVSQINNTLAQKIVDYKEATK